MTIKTKLSLGLSFLFAVIILLAGLGAYFASSLAAGSQEILKDNYESLEYARKMMQATDVLAGTDTIPYREAVKDFQSNLQKQETNITEEGELEATRVLQEHFDSFRKGLMQTSSQNDLKFQLSGVRQSLYRIMELNMHAIVRKSQEARKAANQAITYLAVIGTLSVLVALSFIVNFPGYIANPIRELSQSIKEIANRNYEQRLHFPTHDEFGELADSFNQMARKLDEYEHSNLARLMFEKRRIETIINNMADAIIGIDEKRTILFANQEATLLLGLPEGELVGKYAPDVALQNDLLRHLISANGQNPLKIFDEGKESYFVKDVIAIKSPAGEKDQEELIGQVIILKNITQFRELDLAKSNFIATISHELKTPISSIKMSLTLLRDERIGPMNAEQQKLLAHITEDSDRLLRITGELLDLAQVETGNIQLHYQQTSPAKIIDYACQAMQFQAEQKQIQFVLDMPQGLPAVNADLEKSAWVLVNFLSNAIRYSPEQTTITISAGVMMSESHRLVRFSVRDQGPGIDARYKDRIFDKFFQVPQANGVKGGTGLGLAISKEFINAQGGLIWVESELGEGSTFSFTLPVSS
jgi:PAS domain S-box-containing protein